MVHVDSNNAHLPEGGVKETEDLSATTKIYLEPTEDVGAIIMNGEECFHFEEDFHDLDMDNIIDSSNFNIDYVFNQLSQLNLKLNHRNGDA